MKTWHWATIVAYTMIACVEPYPQVDPHKIKGNDRNFMYNAGAASQAQMIYGQLAAVKGNSAQVRAYGQKIATAHEQAIADLRAIAANDHVELITGMDKIHQKRLALLLTLVGEPFDTAYVSAQLKNHQEAIAMYQFELDSGKYDALRDHASAYLNFTVAQRANAETLALDIAVTPSN